MNIRWSHCVLRVRDLEPMVAFYEDIFGFEVSDRGPLGPEGSPSIVFMTGASSDHHQLALVEARGEEEASSLDHNAFRVDGVADVKTMFERVTADSRVENAAPVTHGNAVSVYFADPEGNGIEVFCDTPWHVKQPQLKIWDPSKSADEVLAAVENDFRDEAEFMPMADYRKTRAQHFGET